MTASPPLNQPETTRPALLWIAVALLGHAGWGSYPVLGRYLQTVSNLPSMSILVLGNAITLLILGAAFWRKIDRRAFGLSILWFFAVIVAARGLTNLLAMRFTLAIYVQLVTLMTPFFVALLAKFFLREPLPPFTIPAIILATLGAVLMMSGDIGGLTLETGLTASDWLGIGLAALSSLCLASYMVIVRHSSKQYKINAETILLVQVVAIMSFAAVFSLIFQEDWSVWQRLGGVDWLVFWAYIGVVLLMANISQVVAIRHIGSTLVGSLLPSRLVIALILGAIVLNEELTSVWQVLGAVIVLLTLSWYLWRQRR